MDTLLFVASKVLFFVVQPSSLAMLATVVGCALLAGGKGTRRARVLAIGGLSALFVGGLSPLANVLTLPLESRFPRHSLEDLAGVRGLIILGGFEEATPAGDRTLGLNEAAERITESARLARLMPGLKVVFSGGVGTLIAAGEGEAERVRRWLIDMGIAERRIVIEDRSRNTWENATETKARLGGEAAGRWLLVTSAAHMPRAMGCFRQVGFDVIAWPVDHRVARMTDLVSPFGSIPDGLRRFDAAAKEWIGLVAYRILGRTSALFPAP